MRMVFLFLLAVNSIAWAGEIALTFDDAPRKSTRWFDGNTRTEKLLEELKRARVDQVAFFATPINLDRDNGADRLVSYARAGHLIANHTHTHRWIHEVGAEAYIEDIGKAHQLLNKHPNFVSWFRYPFLDQGKTREDQVTIAKAIQALGYDHGYVTVDNYDWYMDYQLQQALKAGREPDMAALKDAYIAILWRCILFYDQLAVKALGRSPKHVLLLHENDLAALFIGDLVAFLRKQGWRIISPREAYTDPMFQQQPTGLCRQGRLACLAKESGYQGRTGDTSEDEAFLEQYFEERKVFQ